MTGLLLIAVVAGWLFVAWWIAKKATAKITASGKKTALRVGITALLMALPLTDEIVGGFQFRALCSEGAVLKIDAEKIRGRTVRLVIDPPSNAEVLPGKALKISHSYFRFLDISSGEELASYHQYLVNGGWLIRSLGISGNNSPLIISPSACSPRNRGTLDKQYNFTLIN
jgi:hypothetical protein